MAQHRRTRPSSPRCREAAALAVLVPFAVGPVVWPASLAPEVLPAAASADEAGPPQRPVVRSEVIEPPVVSVTDPLAASPVPRRTSAPMLMRGSSGSIPLVALLAYLRADGVLDASDPGCRLPWQLVAAIGRVESDHGRYGGGALDADGVARPGIYGVALDGRQHTALIGDTDAGRLDRDRRYDRAVGPMQFIPSTWAMFAVDTDGDGRRDPQDIDDAALAAAVYLCSGSEDLGTEVGRRRAVHRYNHSGAYVDLVLSIFDAYLAGDHAISTGSRGTPDVVVREIREPDVVPSPHAAPVDEPDAGPHAPPPEPPGVWQPPAVPPVPPVEPPVEPPSCEPVLPPEPEGPQVEDSGGEVPEPPDPEVPDPPEVPADPPEVPADPVVADPPCDPQAPPDCLPPDEPEGEEVLLGLAGSLISTLSGRNDLPLVFLGAPCAPVRSSSH